jgi:hypothetical protein
MLALKHWGPAGWHFIHAAMMCAPKELDGRQQDEMMQFLVLFGKHLPCPKCRDHFLFFLDRNMSRARVSTRDELVRLLNDAHNEVNARNRKRTFTLAEHYAWISSTPWQPSEAIAGACLVAACLLVAGAAAKKFSRARSQRTNGLGVAGWHPRRGPPRPLNP